MSRQPEAPAVSIDGTPNVSAESISASVAAPSNRNDHGSGSSASTIGCGIGAADCSASAGLGASALTCSQPYDAQPRFSCQHSAWKTSPHLAHVCVASAV